MANQRLTTLGIDLGTNSLGWCLITTSGEPCCEPRSGRIIAIGSRIFSPSVSAGRDAKTGESLAVARRDARATRRRRDRYLRRRKALLKALTQYGLMPAGEDARKKLLKETGDGKGGDLTSDVYALRAQALDEKLDLHHIGRILFQLDQRRGFKSNRKTDKGDNEAGKIVTGVARLDVAIGEVGARTYGEFLHKRRLDGKSVRTRLRPEMGEGARGDGYDFYPSRGHLEKEFDAICAEQARHYPDLLGEDVVRDLRDIIFNQRPLKPALPGRCTYNPDEKRLPKAHPLFQKFRLLKEVNELALVGEDQMPVKLTPDQRDALVLRLRGAKSVSFAALRKVLKAPRDVRFNKESDNRTKLIGDEVWASLSHKDAFGNAWSGFDIARQWEIVSQLREVDDPDVLVDWLRENTGLHADGIDAVCRVSLPEGYGRMGETALAALSDELENAVDENGKVITEAQAAINVYGRTNSEGDRDFQGYAELPKYQQVLARHIPPGTGVPSDPYDTEMGRITNPTVHIALNQLRRVVNAVIKKHGRPDRIAIELGRDLKLSEDQKADINRTIGENTRAAEARSKKLIELGQPDTGYNRMRLKQWEELHEKPEARVCIYTGRPITLSMLFTPAVDIDHILPYSRTLDDSQANRLLCMAEANREKRNKAPVEVAAWASRYDEILARATALPKNKQWRFAANAMERFNDERSFEARQLTDMQYIARMGLTYLASPYPYEEADAEGVLRRNSRVRALPGRMTEMLRRNWALNDLLPDHNFAYTMKAKNRNDHRHHAIDAAVIACTSRALIQKMATASRALESEGAERVVADLKEPWDGFRDELREAVRNTVVSHKPDHGVTSGTKLKKGFDETAGKLHNDTAYGPTDEVDEQGQPRVVRRKPLEAFTTEKLLRDIRDPQLLEALREATRGKTGKEFTAALLAFAEAPGPFQGLRRLRVLETLRTIPIRDKNGKVFKGYKGDSNHRYDVWRLKDGRWVAEVVSTFDVHQPDWQSAVRAGNPTAKKVLSLRQNDLVAFEHPARGKTIARVVKFGANGQITLADHNEAGDLKKRDALSVEAPEHATGDAEPIEFDPFKYFAPTAGGLKKLSVRQIRIDELGTVYDPGPRH
ncbi:type II CRISPR RNA-guided endonuclease Cas9 [Aurantimonas sp. C2-6-R+9]|uniref:type II CRISPR RNA-guided endonuclease Cas9 n=1 Tax=unclassified Aurantimonas TaxID=2638230 RepID=UPI002E19B735|nr:MULTISPECIES: type II CRISPR RNA-guided endonuclease Cas9 [unclassified Aurantimonas]MEC5293141.1 type II CRISPR RNA-guided endonuclease Cas9 [Aurantimonas sp. C2-3-R2]MEC5383457.1 type II CRISPR RNA-guided endonuclease Cas9 [Aurantimonas sp. C2-6-R+9]MEC5414212.1 type II CRISPR RNA-guided endonuclease Cas9 [Aurantimonas sp. C2-4-R8]